MFSYFLPKTQIKAKIYVLEQKKRTKKIKSENCMQYVSLHEWTAQAADQYSMSKKSIDISFNLVDDIK